MVAIFTGFAAGLLVSFSSMLSVDIDQHIFAALTQFWGFSTLRPLQRAAIDAAIAKRDSLVIFPTGGGKSLCYQVPPLITNELCVVVSPLIALMKDQVDGLTLAGYPAAALHSGVSGEDASEIRRRLLAHELRLLLVAPERLLNEGFLSMLVRAKVGSFAIDEAHCISQWGHDFRPEYRRMAELRQVFPDVPIHAYTATATPLVRDDIIAQLDLGATDPEGPVVLTGVFDRPNLTYRVLPRVNLNDQIEEVLQRHKDQAAIVYCLSRDDTEKTAAELRKRRISAKAYHAGMSTDARGRVQEEFSTEKLDVVVATVAFGMGIDRSNVRCVIHASMPKSIEHYQQETGRAGRDGLASECVLFYSSADGARWRRLVEKSAQEADDPPPKAMLDAQYELLSQMQGFCAGARCRHRALSEYFGQAYVPPVVTGDTAIPVGCGACDVCLRELEEVPDSNVVAQKIVSCVARLSSTSSGGGGFGVAHIVDVLRGSRLQKVLDRKHDQLSVFGLLAAFPKQELASLVNQLVDSGHLQRTPGEYPVIVTGPHAKALLKSEARVVLVRPKVSEAIQPATPTNQRVSKAAWQETMLTVEERSLFDTLRALRRTVAQELGVPPYIVFGDATLEELCKARPSTLDSFGHIRGVGERKLQQFGERFVQSIVHHCQARGLDLDQSPSSASPGLRVNIERGRSSLSRST